MIKVVYPKIVYAHAYLYRDLFFIRTKILLELMYEREIIPLLFFFIICRSLSLSCVNFRHQTQKSNKC